MSPFRPKGEVARWRLVYDVLARASVNDTVSYEVLADVLDLDPWSSRHKVQAAVHRASPVLERETRKAVEAVPNVGYRIVQAVEHLRLAQAQQRKSYNSLGRGRSKVVYVDVSGMDLESRRAIDATARAIAVQLEFQRRFADKQAMRDQLDSLISQGREKSPEEIADIRQRLASLEQRRLESAA